MLTTSPYLEILLFTVDSVVKAILIVYLFLKWSEIKFSKAENFIKELYFFTRIFYAVSLSYATVLCHNVVLYVCHPNLPICDGTL
jgi:hypothetical protein